MLTFEITVLDTTISHRFANASVSSKNDALGTGVCNTEPKETYTMQAMSKIFACLNGLLRTCRCKDGVMGTR